MTIKELYEYCVTEGMGDCDIRIEYECTDSWYAFSEIVEKDMITFRNNEVCIEISDDI